MNDDAKLRPATYGMRRDGKRPWTVYTVATGLPAVVNGIPQVGKDMDDADDLVDLLRHVAARGEVDHRRFSTPGNWPPSPKYDQARAQKTLG